MADSLMDFGNAGQLAQGNLRNAMQLYQMGLQEQQLSLQDRRTSVDEQQLKINQQSAQTARLNSIKSLMDHPLVQNNEQLQDQLFVTMAPELGIPTDGLMNRLTQSRKDRMELMSATVGNDPRKATEAILKLGSGMDAETFGKYLKNMEAIPSLHAKGQLLKQQMEINEAKFAELRQNQAIVNEGRGPLTALSASLRRDTSILNSQEYKNAVKLSKTLGGKNVLDSSSKHLSEKDKTVLQVLFTDNANKKADALDPQIEQLQYQLDTANQALLDMQHGVKPVGNMREELTARIATLQPILGAQRDLQAFYRDPLNSEKAALAKHAYETVEARRVELEAMDKKLDAQRMGMVNLANEKFDYKQAQDNSIALGQQEYFALPDKQRTGQAAAMIANKITRETGVPVKVSDITKDPNAPQSVTNLTIAQEKAFDQELGKKNVDDIKATQTKARDAASIIDTIHQGRALIDSGAITGVGAEYVTKFGQALSQAGFTQSEDSVANTQAYVALMASNVAKHIKEFGAGTGLSDADREYATKMAGGDITVSEKSIRKILDLNERAARRTIEMHNKAVKGIKTMVPLTVELPPEYVPRGKQQSGAASPPSGGYGNRPDGTQKGAGYFGEIPSPINPGEFSTELTIGVNIGGEEVDIPLITPNLSRSEIESVMRGRESKEIIGKAVEHAKSRMKQGKSPYAGDGEAKGLPEWKPKEFEQFYKSLRKGDVYTGPDGKRRTKQ